MRHPRAPPRAHARSIFRAYQRCAMRRRYALRPPLRRHNALSAWRHYMQRSASIAPAPAWPAAPSRPRRRTHLRWSGAPRQDRKPRRASRGARSPARSGLHSAPQPGPPCRHHATIAVRRRHSTKSLHLPIRARANNVRRAQRQRASAAPIDCHRARAEDGMIQRGCPMPHAPAHRAARSDRLASRVRTDARTPRHPRGRRQSQWRGAPQLVSRLRPKTFGGSHS